MDEVCCRCEGACCNKANCSGEEGRSSGEEGRSSGGKAGSDGDETKVKVVTDGGVRYSVPSILRPDHMADLTTIRFRVGSVFKDVDVVTYADGKELARLHKRVMAPGEMEQLILRKADLIADGIPAEYRITIESK